MLITLGSAHGIDTRARSIVRRLYKTSLSRLKGKYNDAVTQLDEANDEIVERESGIENATQAIFDLRTQIDRLNGELAEAESATIKAEAERDRIQLLFIDSTGSG